MIWLDEKGHLAAQSRRVTVSYLVAYNICCKGFF